MKWDLIDYPVMLLVTSPFQISKYCDHDTIHVMRNTTCTTDPQLLTPWVPRGTFMSALRGLNTLTAYKHEHNENYIGWRRQFPEKHSGYSDVTFDIMHNTGTSWLSCNVIGYLSAPNESILWPWHYEYYAQHDMHDWSANDCRIQTWTKWKLYLYLHV